MIERDPGIVVRQHRPDEPDDRRRAAGLRPVGRVAAADRDAVGDRDAIDAFVVAALGDVDGEHAGSEAVSATAASIVCSGAAWLPAFASEPPVATYSVSSTVTVWLPVMPAVTASVAVTSCEPAVRRTTPAPNVWVPLSPAVNV